MARMTFRDANYFFPPLAYCSLVSVLLFSCVVSRCFERMSRSLNFYLTCNVYRWRPETGTATYVKAVLCLSIGFVDKIWALLFKTRIYVTFSLLWNSLLYFFGLELDIFEYRNLSVLLISCLLYLRTHHDVHFSVKYLEIFWLNVVYILV
jgi:hypothetical protein